MYNVSLLPQGERGTQQRGFDASVAFGNFFKKIAQSVTGVARKASQALTASVAPMARVLRSGLDFLVGRKLDPEAADRVRDTLIQADVSPRMADDLVTKLEAAYRDREIKSTSEVLTFLKETIRRDFPPLDSAPNFAERGTPTVILIVGVNGSGKTTSIAKLAHRFKSDGMSVLLAPADTFRAAAVQQLILWAERVGVDYIPAQQGHDPASIAYQAVEKALAKNIDIVIVDTAGRLDNKKNLMDELEKITRVIKKKLPSAPHEVLSGARRQHRPDGRAPGEELREDRRRHRRDHHQARRHGEGRGGDFNALGSRAAGEVDRAGRENDRYRTVRRGCVPRRNFPD